MQRADLDLALQWAAAEGWNPGQNDATPFAAADPHGFLIGRLNDQPIAIISVVKYSNSFGFLGCYIVHPDYRGQGFGWKIWQAGMAYLSGCNVGLDGVLAQQDNYRRAGFKLSHRNIRFQGINPPSSEASSSGGNITALASINFEALSDYDLSFYPARREAFLRSWITQPKTISLGLILGTKLVGYGVIRPCQTGYKIGPLFADTAEGAETLFSALCKRTETGAEIFLDVPECNRAAIHLAESHSMNMVFETARMYTGTAPDISLNRTFGNTSFELG